MTHLSRLLACSALASGLLTASAFAAEPTTEVVITAQKRPEPLSRAPLSVAVVTGEQMERNGAHDLKDLQVLTPSLLITSTANEAQTTARLRGVGTVGDNPGLESSVGVTIDGVLRPRTATAMSDLGVLDRVEILKGPQSDTYGKGASAGIIQVVTKLPSLTPSQSYELTAGSQWTLGASAYLTGPLADSLAGSLYVATRQRDGQYDIHTGDGPRTKTDDGDINYDSIRGQLLYAPSGSLRMRLIADYTRRDESCCAGTAIAIGGTRGYIDSLSDDEGTASVVDPEGREAWANRPTGQEINDGGVSLQTDLAITPTLQLTSITAARYWDHNSGYDADFSSADVYYRNEGGSFGNRFNTVSQEVRLNGKTWRFDWMAGVFLDTEELTRNDETIYGADYEGYLSLLLSGGANPARVSEITGLPVGQSFVPGQGAHDVHDQRERNAAIFGHVDWFVTDTLTVLIGARSNHQKKTLVSHYTTSDAGIACARATASKSVICQAASNPAFTDLTNVQGAEESATVGSIKVKWQITPGIMTYASYGEGWKGAGFNLDREQTSAFAVDRNTSFGAETSRAYELGAKARFFDGRLAVDGTLFDQRFRNFQLNTFLGTSFLVTSIPNLRSKGVELESRYVTGFGLNLRAGATYTDAKFGPEAITGLPLLANNTPSFAPEWSSAFGLDYSRMVHGLKLTASLDGRYNSDYNTGSDLAPIKIQKAYTLYNGRVGIGAPDGNWTLELWGLNLTDETYYQVAFSAPFQSGSFKAFTGNPRTVGLTLRLKH
ncbi:TonB-denpendent receptor [Asticcacaulis sp. AC460]|uniref:TonB-dependent receptor n=1 Tax=Asticcacaulis sp. AC460 TaxID=1282360 RepID=UPI0003C40325|nr:TonB-dependent receptor [Asticcacaulis sp. AC460]ESQ90832.1 TonB-denpendent receptor [Asticcacaulis sp. AC460]